MTVGQLIEHLEKIREKYGDNLEVDILTETEDTGQVEQSLGSLAVATPKTMRVKLLPVGFD